MAATHPFRIALSASMILLAAPSVTLAQEGLATSSTLRGRNTIQQAPSGGAEQGGVRSYAPRDEGRPTAEDRREEKRDTTASEICRGC